MTARKSRTPLTIGWEAGRANAIPALVIQATAFGLLIAYYTNSSIANGLNKFAEFKRVHGLPLVLVASIAAGAIISGLFLILFFQHGRPSSRNVRNLLFTIRSGDSTDHWSIFCTAAKRHCWAMS